MQGLSDFYFAAVSPNQNPLRAKQLTAYTFVRMAETASERARLRLREEMTRKHLSQRDLAGILDWSQSRVSKNLNARIELGLDDLAAMCFAVGIALTEAVRDRGMEFCAEMAPHELRFLERLRQLPPDKRELFFRLMDVSPNTRLESKRASGEKKLPRGRGSS